MLGAKIYFWVGETSQIRSSACGLSFRWEEDDTDRRNSDVIFSYGKLQCSTTLLKACAADMPTIQLRAVKPTTLGAGPVITPSTDLYVLDVLVAMRAQTPRA